MKDWWITDDKFINFLLKLRNNYPHNGITFQHIHVGIFKKMLEENWNMWVTLPNNNSKYFWYDKIDYLPTFLDSLRNIVKNKTLTQFKLL